MAKRQIASTGEIVDTGEASSDDTPSMHLKVHSPFRVYFDGIAQSISATNDTGPFDILPRHHNFITLLGAGDLVVRPMQGNQQTIRISGGIMHVKEDQVVVFLDV